MSEKRTLNEIAAAHAKAMDDLWRFLYPESYVNARQGAAERLLERRTPEQYFAGWAREDMNMIQEAIQARAAGI